MWSLMIDWKQKCLELAKLVDLHRRDRMITDKKKAWKLAKEILDLAKKEAYIND